MIINKSNIHNIWFTSDTHIGHDNILNLGEGRPFNSLNHMSSTIRDKWNNTVEPSDTIFVMGDIAMGNFEQSIQFFTNLPGNKLMIAGNHDKIFSGTNTKTRIERFTPLYEEVGFTILPENTSVTFVTDVGEKEVLLSHFPYGEEWLGDNKDKFLKNRPVDTGLPLVHGHSHQRTKFESGPRQFSIGVDANEFTPVSAVEILRWIEQL